MLGVLFGWRKASKCKKLIKKVQCRLKLLLIKRTVIVKQLREDIAHLLRNGHDHVAFNRLDQLYMDENMKELYELLDSFCEFVLMNLSYIKRHRDCPNDVKEAVSSLVFASARFGELPELQVIRKLFGERYGQKFATGSVELLPGNLVNPQMIEKLSMNSVSDYAKNRLLDEIIRECFFKPGLLAIEYNPSPKESSDAKESEQNPSDFQFVYSKELIQSPQAYIANDIFSLQSSSPIKEESSKLETFALPNTADSSSDYPEQSLVYLDDIEEFKSTAMVHQQDQSIFIFKPIQIQKPGDEQESPARTKSDRKRQRRRSLSKDYKYSINDNAYEVYYSGSPHQRKHQKKIHELDGLVQSFRFWLKEEEPKTPSRSPSSTSNVTRPPYMRATSMPQQRDRESMKSDFGRSSSLPVESPIELSSRGSFSPRHVHPKLPDYDEIEAKFVALKKVHQLSKLVRNPK